MRPALTGRSGAMIVILACAYGDHAEAGWTLSGQIEVTPPASLIWDPTNADTLYAGETGAIFRSADLGDTWSRIALPPGDAQDIVDGLLRNPSGPSLLVASQQEDVLRTINRGATWIAVPTLPNTAAPPSFALDPSQLSTLWATDGTSVYRSINGGANWIAPHPAVDGGIALALDACKTQGLYLIKGSGPLEKSVDGGASYKVVLQGTQENQVVSRVVSADCADTYAILTSNATTIANAPPGGVLMASHDSGAKFAVSGTGIGSSPRLVSLGVDGKNASVVYAGGYATGNCSLFVSADRASQWKCAELGDEAKEIGLIAVRRGSAGAIASGTGGLWRSSNSGTSWTAAKAVGLTQPSVENLLSAGPDWTVNTAFGIYKSTDAGLRWSRIDGNLPGFSFGSGGGTGPTATRHLALDSAASPQALYFSGPAGTFVTRNDGKSYREIEPIKGQVPAPTALATDPFTPGRVWLALLNLATQESLIARSDDFGATWQLFAAPDQTLATGIWVDPFHKNQTYVATEQGFYSTGLGKEWASILGYGGISQMVFAAKPSPVLYAYVPSTPYQTATILKAGSSGSRWVQVGTPDQKELSAIAAMPGGADLFALAADGTIYQSTDQAARWTDITGSLRNRQTIPDGLWATGTELGIGIPTTGLYLQPYTALSTK